MTDQLNPRPSRSRLVNLIKLFLNYDYGNQKTIRGYIYDRNGRSVSPNVHCNVHTYLGLLSVLYSGCNHEICNNI